MTARRLSTHPAVRGFDRAAEVYERARPEYPDAAVRALGRVLGLRPGTTLVELGSGTGKLTRTLGQLGAARVAVEPMPGMRRVFARMVPDVPVLPGTAEEIPLPGGFADAVVAAQAFQWFDPARALPEIARVLRPGGGLGLLWNVREDRSRAWTRQLTDLIDGYRVARRIPRVRERRWRSVFDRPGVPFLPLTLRRFEHRHRIPRERVVDRFLSISVIALLPAAERRRVAARVREILDSDLETRGRREIDMPYHTELYWTFRRPDREA